MAIVLLLFVGREGSSAREASAVVLERRRLARELHDAVGSRLVAMALHARQLPQHAGVRGSSGQVIDELAQQTMRDLRRVLSRLDADGAEPDRGGSLEGVVGELVSAQPADRVRYSCAGREVDRPATPAVRHALVRITQECLANALKHGTGTVRVSLAVGEDLLLTVVNDVPSERGSLFALSGEGRRGLRGMRERASSVGGHVEYECGPDGRFEVRAWLPLTAGARREAERGAVACLRPAS
ncbi:sensor histidine kinase [Streptomyces alkaliterrae]|nr:histidine kinase [Streptomyces alkaliterrae]MBB1253379.1 hypothetical protein [Streptomyces alkaliterrae]MBB1259173.1 hypothetical protein [Streptomyces alkaliterrae]